MLHDPPAAGSVSASSGELFFDPTLPLNRRVRSSSLFFGLFTRRNKSLEAAEDSSHHGRHEIWSTIPRTPANTRPLLAMHPSIPYSLAFYHVHAAVQTYLSQRRGGTSTKATGGTKRSDGPFCELTSLTCAHPFIGSRPRLRYSITPRIHPTTGHFLLGVHISFNIPPPGDSGPPMGGGRTFRYSKNWFVSRGYRSFRLCAHMMRVFRSHRAEEHAVSATSTKPPFMAGIEYSTKNIFGQDFRDEWRSELGRQPRNGSCGVCATDTSMFFAVDVMSGIVTVEIRIYRDLGRGETNDVMWLAAAGMDARTGLQRKQGDFGRVRRQWEEAGAQS